MDLKALEDLFVNHFYKLLVTGFFGIITFMVKRLADSYKESLALQRESQDREREEQDIIRQGVLSLLRYRIHRFYELAKVQGYLTLSEKADLDDLYSLYSALGGNGATKRRYDYLVQTYEVRDV